MPVKKSQSKKITYKRRSSNSGNQRSVVKIVPRSKVGLNKEGLPIGYTVQRTPAEMGKPPIESPEKLISKTSDSYKNVERVLGVISKLNDRTIPDNYYPFTKEILNDFPYLINEPIKKWFKERKLIDPKPDFLSDPTAVTQYLNTSGQLDNFNAFIDENKLNNNTFLSYLLKINNKSFYRFAVNVNQLIRDVDESDTKDLNEDLSYTIDTFFLLLEEIKQFLKENNNQLSITVKNDIIKLYKYLYKASAKAFVYIKDKVDKREDLNERENLEIYGEVQDTIENALKKLHELPYYKIPGIIGSGSGRGGNEYFQVEDNMRSELLPVALPILIGGEASYALNDASQYQSFSKPDLVGGVFISKKLEYKIGKIAKALNLSPILTSAVLYELSQKMPMDGSGAHIGEINFYTGGKNYQQQLDYVSQKVNIPKLVSKSIINGLIAGSLNQEDRKNVDAWMCLNPIIHAPKFYTSGGSLPLPALDVRGFLNPTSSAPIEVRDMLKNYGTWIIQKYRVVRKPVYEAIDKLANILTLGDYNDRKVSRNIDTYFHLFSEVFCVPPDGDNKEGKLILIEKNQRVNVKYHRLGGIDHDNKKYPEEGINIPLKGILTIGDWIGNTENYCDKNGVGNNLWKYDATTFNCQNFTNLLLKANGLWTQQIDKFVLQPAEESLPKWLKSVFKGITNLSARIDAFLFGRGKKGGKKGGAIPLDDDQQYVVNKFPQLLNLINSFNHSNQASEGIHALALKNWIQHFRNEYGTLQRRRIPRSDRWMAKGTITDQGVENLFRYIEPIIDATLDL